MDECFTLYSSSDETGSSIAIYKCPQPTPIPTLCHGNYLYENNIYLYTIACPPLDSTETPITSTTTTAPVETTTKLTTTQISTTTSLTRVEQNYSLNYTRNVSLMNASKTNVKVLVPQDPILKKAFDYSPIIIISSVCLALLLALPCAVFILKKKKKKLKRQNSSSVMPRIVYENTAPPLPPRPRPRNKMTEDQQIHRECKKTLTKLVNTVVKYEGGPPAPSRPPRPRAGRMRKQTLDYLHDQNPILSALKKPTQTFARAGQERAERFREEILTNARQERRSRGGQRLRNILRIKQLGKK